MSSIYRSAYILIYSLNLESTQSQSIIGAFISLNSITRYLYRLSYNLNTIFYSSPSLIRIIQKAALRLSLVNQNLPQSLSLSLSILSNRYRFFLVISLSYRQSTYSLLPPSFLAIKKIGYPTLDLDFRIFPIAIFLLI